MKRRRTLPKRGHAWHGGAPARRQSRRRGARSLLALLPARFLGDLPWEHALDLPIS